MDKVPVIKQNTNWLAKIATYMNVVGCFWTGLLMLIVFVDVSGRFLFNRPLTGAPEIIQQSIVGITFLQIPFVELINKHLTVTALYDKMVPKVKRIIDFMNALLGMLVFALITYSGFEYLIEAIKINEYDGTSASIMLPTWPVRSIIILGSIMMVLLSIWRIERLIKRNEGSLV